MKKLIMMVLGLMVAVGMAGMAIAGNIDSPGAPSAGSGMYTLQNLYDYLTSGTALTVPGSFQEPGAGPGSTMKSTKQIGDDVKALFVQCNATADKVLQGTKFFCTVAGSWGVKTGTLLCPTPVPTITPIPTATPTWYQMYGPGGSNEVWLSGSGVYVAKNPSGSGTYHPSGGCSYNGMVTWASGVTAFSRSDWYIADATTLNTICNEKSNFSNPPPSGSMYTSTVCTPSCSDRNYVNYFGPTCYLKNDTRPRANTYDFDQTLLVRSGN